MKVKSKRFISRSSEGRYWERVEEKDGVISISVRHNHDDKIISGFMRKSDYEHSDCYPVIIPYFRNRDDI